jgi:hypothetical protein
VTAAPVQECVDLAGIEAGVARFGRGRHSHSVAVMDIFAADTSLATADDATQEEVLAGRAQFLNAQTAPFQVLVRAEPVDLEGHTRRIQGRVLHLPEPLADVAHDYVSFLTALAQQRTLLERHCLVVLADSTRERSTLWEQCKNSLGRLRAAARRRGVASQRPDVVTTELARRLSARCDLVGRHLARSGLRAHRLDSSELPLLKRGPLGTQYPEPRPHRSCLAAMDVDRPYNWTAPAPAGAPDTVLDRRTSIKPQPTRRPARTDAPEREPSPLGPPRARRRHGRVAVPGRPR